MENSNRYWSTEYHHSYPWHTIASAYWKRYPNPHSKHVYSEDMIDIKIDKTTGVLRTKRLIMKSNKLPWWGEHLFAARRVAVIEEAVIDPKMKCMTTYTRNIGLRFFMGTTEKVTYLSCQGVNNCDVACPLTNNCVDKSADEYCQSTTNVQKEVWIESDCLGLRSAIRTFGMDRYKRNYLAAAEGFEYVLEKYIRSQETGKFRNTESSNNSESTMHSNIPVSSGIDVTKTINLKSYSKIYS